MPTFDTEMGNCNCCKKEELLSFCSSKCTGMPCLMRETITPTVSGTVCPTKVTQVTATTSQTPATSTVESFMSTATQMTTMPGSTVTTQPENLSMGLTASTGILVALLAGTILGWVSTCVYGRYWYKRFNKQQE